MTLVFIRPRLVPPRRTRWRFFGAKGFGRDAGVFRISESRAAAPPSRREQQSARRQSGSFPNISAAGDLQTWIGLLAFADGEMMLSSSLLPLIAAH